MRIETERLIVRKVDPERDFEAWARTMADARVVRFLGSAPMSRALAWRHMAAIIGHWAFRELGWPSVVHVILAGNDRSIAVAQRLGSTFLRAQQGLDGKPGESAGRPCSEEPRSRPSVPRCFAATICSPVATISSISSYSCRRSWRAVGRAASRGGHAIVHSENRHCHGRNQPDGPEM